MTLLKACPECGDVVEVTEQDPAPYCVGCLSLGHKFAVMDANELLISAESNARQGFDRTAFNRRGIACNLVRYSAIKECIRVTSDEYREAQREGFDADAAHDCAMDGLSELLRAYDEADGRR